MSKVLVIAEQRDGKLKGTTLEVASFCASAQQEVHVALLGKGVESLVAELSAVGVKKVHLIEGDSLQNYSADAYVAALKPVIDGLKPDCVFSSHTPTGRDFMPRLASRLGVGLAADCISLEFKDGQPVLRRPVYAGKATAEVEFLGAGPRMATIRSNALGSPKSPGGNAEVIKASAATDGIKAKLLEVVKGQTTRPDVSEASKVISGGRSLKNAENFKLLEDLADTIGAAVGASRAAVDAGFRPHRDQVGQTGKVVSPGLYIACGVSGAIQHLAGMRTSKVIVAINTDPEAPIFQVADYGIVGDLFQVVPALTEELKKLKS